MPRRNRAFGWASPRERREADLFFRDLLGVPRAPRRLPSVRREALEAHEPGGAGWIPAETAPEAAIGQATIGDRIFLVEPRTATLSSATFHDALRHALLAADHSVIQGGPLDTGSTFSVSPWGPRETMNAPPAIGFDGTGAASLVLAAGERAYFQAKPLASGVDAVRWVDVPELRVFFELPTTQQDDQRAKWRNAILKAAPVNPSTSAAFTKAELDALATPTLRLLLASHVSGAIPVKLHSNGGRTSGVTLAMLRYPISEPHVYLRVISMKEGKLESINAWDQEAGISLGPIQFNVKRGQLFELLWWLWENDRELFDEGFSTLGWQMRNSSGFPELKVKVGTSDVWLQGKGDSTNVKKNYAYFQSGDPSKSSAADIEKTFRRKVLKRFLEVVAWPHVQEAIVDVSLDWLQPGLDKIHAGGIPTLDPLSPDKDTFVLKSMLMSAYVRYSGSVGPLLGKMKSWSSVSDKLANWKTALANMTGKFDPAGDDKAKKRNANLLERLTDQEKDAKAVHDEIMAVKSSRATTP